MIDNWGAVERFKLLQISHMVAEREVIAGVDSLVKNLHSAFLVPEIELQVDH